MIRLGIPTQKHICLMNGMFMHTQGLLTITLRILTTDTEKHQAPSPPPDEDHWADELEDMLDDYD
jgi:hypothetical protein